MNTSIYIGTPTYSGETHAQYTLALVDTVALLTAASVQSVVHIDCGGTLLPMSRNRIVDKFWHSSCTHLLCIDSDIGWNPHDVLRLLHHKEDFVAGVYPGRKGNGYTFIPRKNSDGTLVASNGLFEADGVPAGFMLLSRGTISKMRDTHVSDVYRPDPASTTQMFGFFNTEIRGGEFWGEDYVFCRKAIEAGITVRVDPTLQFDHAGVKGTLTDVLIPKNEVTNGNSI